MTPEDRFWAKVSEPTAAGCRLWTASKNAAGYGYFSQGRRNRYAHRVAWELANGPIPDGLEIDHVVCDNPSCVNVAHLALSTGRANTLRGQRNAAAINARKSCCLRNHPLSGDNLHIEPSGRRICRACKRAENRTDRARERKRDWWRRRRPAR